MPSMFPTPATPRGDRNRDVLSWQPGDPTPRVLIVAFALLLVLGCFMVLTGALQLTASWNRSPRSAEEAETMAFVLTNVRILGGISVAAGLAIIWFARSVRDGKRRGRRVLLLVSCLAIFFLLAGWVMQFTGPGNAVLAFGLACSLLLAFRPSAETFFDAQAEAAAAAEFARPTVAEEERQ